MFKKLFVFFIAFVLFSCGAGKKDYVKVPLIPMEDFFKNPEEVGFKLSPNGNYIALMKPWNRRLNIFVRKIGDSLEKRITSSKNRDIGGFFWVNDERIAFIKDKGGNENFHLFAVNIDGSNFKELTPFENVKVQLIDDLYKNDKEILIGMNKRDPRIFDVYRINVYTGDMKMIAKNPGNITGWLTDHDGKLRVGIASDGVNTVIYYRDNEKQDFKPVIKTDFRESIDPLMFTFDNKYIYVASNIGRDKKAIYKYDLKKNKELDLIYENNEVDVNRLISSDKKKKLLGVVYVTDKTHYYFLDKERKKFQEDLEKRLPGYEIAVISSNLDEDKFLIRTYSDKTRGAYYFYDIKTKDFRKLADVSPWLKEEYMADMKPIQYKSRDGLLIHGYLTIPKVEKVENLPVVVNPHGGPWARDYWGFNPEVQFLANRGYVVLQMNFRGSVGYGRKFWEAGFKQWGRAMQDDITDGVKWLISKGIADTNKIAIYGGSYGGYATLAGLTFTPDLYACGIDYVGPSNLFTLVNSLPPYWEPLRQMFYEMMGDPKKDSLLLWQISPVFHADKIKAPLLVAQGANDPRVKKTESDQIVNALKKRGIDVLYIVKDNEGHGFRNEENRFDFYRAMEKFLAKHLGGRAEQK